MAVEGGNRRSSIVQLAADIASRVAGIEPPLSPPQAQQAQLTTWQLLGTLKLCDDVTWTEFVENAAAEVLTGDLASSMTTATCVLQGLVLTGQSTAGVESGAEVLITVVDRLILPVAVDTPQLATSLLHTALDCTPWHTMPGAGHRLAEYALAKLSRPLSTPGDTHTWARDDPGDPTLGRMNWLARGQEAQQINWVSPGEQRPGGSLNHQWLAASLASQLLQRLLEDGTSDGSAEHDLFSLPRAQVQILHEQVLSILRAPAAPEAVRLQVVRGLVEPLYRAWRPPEALEELWGVLAGATGTLGLRSRVELLCTCLGSLNEVLQVVKRGQFWDVVYAALDDEDVLCRKRGLHVLQSALAWLETAAAKGPAEEAAGLDRQAIAGWGRYLRVLETLEQEVEMHLVEQVWPLLVAMCRESPDGASKGTATTPPPQSFRWVALLLQRAFSAEGPAVRRNSISRFVRGEAGLQGWWAVEPVWISNVLLPALNFPALYRGAADDFPAAVSSFLRDYLASQGPEGQRLVILAILAATRDGILANSTAVQAAFGSFAPARTTSIALASASGGGPALSHGGNRVSGSSSAARSGAKTGSAGLSDVTEKSESLPEGASGGMRIGAGAAEQSDSVAEPASAVLGLEELAVLQATCRVVLPPLSVRRRVGLVDGVVALLTRFVGCRPARGQDALQHSSAPAKDGEAEALFSGVLGVLLALPLPWVTGRYLPTLAAWVAGPSGFGAGIQAGHWLQDVLSRRLLHYLDSSARGGPGGGGEGEGTAETAATELAIVLCLFAKVAQDSTSSPTQFNSTTAPDGMDATSVVEALGPLLHTLSVCYSRPYTPRDRVLRAMRLVSALGSTGLRSTPAGPAVWSSVQSAAGEMVACVCVNLAQAVSSRDDLGAAAGLEAQTFLQALSTILRGFARPALAESQQALEGTLTECCACLEDPARPPGRQLLALSVLRCLLQQAVGGSDAPVDLPVLPLIDSLRQRATAAVLTSRLKPPRGGGGRRWGQMCGEHSSLKWACLALLLANQSASLDARPDQSHTLEAVLDSLEDCTREGMPAVLRCVGLLLPGVMAATAEGERVARLEGILQAVLPSYEAMTKRTVGVTEALLRAFFQPALMCQPGLNSGPLLVLFRSLVDTGISRKPHVLRCVVRGCLAAWGRQLDTMEAYADDVVQLLVYKEWATDLDHSADQTSDGEEDGVVGEDTDGSAPQGTAEAIKGIARLQLLAFVEKTLIRAATTSGDKVACCLLERLTLGLLGMQASEEFASVAVVNSTAYGRKLRSWQALCVLCGYLTHAVAAHLQPRVLDTYWEAHRLLCLPAIRQAQEVFGLRMLLSDRDAWLPRLVQELSEHNQKGQVSASLMIMTAYITIKDCDLSLDHQVQLLQAVLPWLPCVYSVGRVVAQLICSRLLPQVLEGWSEVLGGGASGEVQLGCLRALDAYLRENREMVKLRARKANWIRQMDVERSCTVGGLLDLFGLDEQLEIRPENVSELVQQAVTELYASQDPEHTPLATGENWDDLRAKVWDGSWFEALAAQDDEASPGPSQDTGSEHIQRKILPWSALGLGGAEAAGRALRGASPSRQPIIMCASFVDKGPNLGGLARTCEIFGASKLLVPDMKILEHDSFASTAVTAHHWLPIEELPEASVVHYLRKAKREGYTVIAVEQTSNSVCITQMVFPKRAVLLLGKERQGIPVSCLQEVDCCVEIPQLGVIRSLNVHVTGAIVLWEYTRQHLVAA